MPVIQKQMPLSPLPLARLLRKPSFSPKKIRPERHKLFFRTARQRPLLKLLPKFGELRLQRLHFPAQFRDLPFQPRQSFPFHSLAAAMQLRLALFARRRCVFDVLPKRRQTRARIRIFPSVPRHQFQVPRLLRPRLPGQHRHQNRFPLHQFS
jgi:hypothetical protein